MPLAARRPRPRRVHHPPRRPHHFTCPTPASPSPTPSFRSDQPYTYTGDILIATNPYRWLDMYSPALMLEHKEQLRQVAPPLHAPLGAPITVHCIDPYSPSWSLQALAPHAFATSAAAYRGPSPFHPPTPTSPSTLPADARHPSRTLYYDVDPRLL